MLSTGNIGPISGQASAYARNVSAANTARTAAVTVTTPVTPVQQVSSVKDVLSMISPEDTAQAVRQVRDYVKNIVPELDFSIDDDTGKLVVKLMDMSTQEVLRQIPSEEMIHVAKMLDKLQGLLVRERA